MRAKKGQSIVEVVIAVAVGTVIIVGVLTAISPLLRSGKEAQKLQTASSLGKELIENVIVFAEGDWHAIADIATTSANKFYLITSSSPFSTSSGIETVVISGVSYTRYFYVDYVYRDSGGRIEEGESLFVIFFCCFVVLLFCCFVVL